MWTSFKTFRSSGRPLDFVQGKGFTLIELLVVSSIVIIITTVLLFRHERFNSATLLRSLGYSVALSIRQAQLYGTSVREVTSGGIFAPSYGIYFKSGDATQYFLAADLNQNGALATNGTEDVSPSPYNINGGYQIKDFCAYVASGGAAHCKSNGIITSFTIRFVRPNPDALFVTDAPGGPYLYSSAYIQLESPGEDTRGITITTTGQISVGISGT